MNDTKQRILDVSLELFSQMVFCGIYPRYLQAGTNQRKALYIITSKVSRLFFDELLCLFENKASDMMCQLDKALAEQTFFRRTKLLSNCV